MHVFVLYRPIAVATAQDHPGLLLILHPFSKSGSGHIEVNIVYNEEILHLLGPPPCVKWHMCHPPTDKWKREDIPNWPGNLSATSHHMTIFRLLTCSQNMRNIFEVYILNTQKPAAALPSCSVAFWLVVFFFLLLLGIVRLTVSPSPNHHIIGLLIFQWMLWEHTAWFYRDSFLILKKNCIALQSEALLGPIINTTSHIATVF